MEQENLKLKVSASPHVRSKATTSDIMFDVVIALVPATAFGLYIFGWYAALLVAVCIGSCVGFEALYQKCMGKKVTVGDFSAVVTGLLLALNLPPNLLDGGCRFRICNHYRKAAFWRTGTEFYEPGTWSEMLPAAVVLTLYDKLRIRWCGNCNTTCDIEAYRHGELKKYVPWIYRRNDR